MRNPSKVTNLHNKNQHYVDGGHFKKTVLGAFIANIWIHLILELWAIFNYSFIIFKLLLFDLLHKYIPFGEASPVDADLKVSILFPDDEEDGSKMPLSSLRSTGFLWLKTTSMTLSAYFLWSSTPPSDIRLHSVTSSAAKHFEKFAVTTIWKESSGQGCWT